MKRTACECRLNNIVLNNPVGFWSAPVGLLLELGWVLPCGYLEQKRGRGVIVGQSIGQAVCCAWQMHSR